jgi:hypothetical protein
MSEGLGGKTLRLGVGESGSSLMGLKVPFRMCFAVGIQIRDTVGSGFVIFFSGQIRVTVGKEFVTGIAFGKEFVTPE